MATAHAFNSRHATSSRVEAAPCHPLSSVAPQPFCPSCETMADEHGICPGCDTVIDRWQFFAVFPDAPDTDWRPWMTEPVEDAPRIIVWDMTR